MVEYKVRCVRGPLQKNSVKTNSISAVTKLESVINKNKNLAFFFFSSFCVVQAYLSTGTLFFPHSITKLLKLEIPKTINCESEHIYPLDTSIEPLYQQKQQPTYDKPEPWHEEANAEAEEVEAEEEGAVARAVVARIPKSHLEESLDAVPPTLQQQRAKRPRSLDS